MLRWKKNKNKKASSQPLSVYKHPTKKTKVEPQMMWKKAKSLTTKVSDHHIEREDHYSCAS
jgi:hypothetical protein